MIPPQFPGPLNPTGLLDVKTMGELAVPLAINLAPLQITNDEFAYATLPLITVPASIVKVAPLVT